MFISEAVVGAIFRIANFFIVLFVASYVFKRKGLSLVLGLMAKEEADHNALLNEQVSLEQEQSQLTTRLQAESLQCEQFKIKIDEWKKRAEIERERNEKERNERMTALDKKMKHWGELRERDRIAQRVAQQMIPELQKTLSDHFKNEKMGSDYLNSIMCFMNERLS